MTVKELIKKLQNLDENLEVACQGYCANCCGWEEEIIEDVYETYMLQCGQKVVIIE